MGEIFKRTIKGKLSQRWYGKVRRGNLWQNVILFTDKVASQRELIRLQAEADRRAAGVITDEILYAQKPLSEHLKDYLADIKRRNLDSEHAYICELYINKMIRLGDWSRVSDLTANNVRAVLALLQAGDSSDTKKKQVKPATINRYLARIKTFVHWLRDNHRITADPLAGLKMAKETFGHRRGLTDQEIAALLKSPADRARFYRLLLLTGLRKTEAASLLWGDLHLNGQSPFIQLRAEQTKNGKADQLPLHPDLVAMFAKMGKHAPHDRVFTKIPTKQHLLADIRAQKLDPAAGGIGLVDLHSLRHTFDRLVIESGCNIKEAQTLMRHSDPKMTMNVYAKAGKNALSEVVRRIQLVHH